MRLRCGKASDEFAGRVCPQVDGHTDTEEKVEVVVFTVEKELRVEMSYVQGSLFVLYYSRYLVTQKQETRHSLDNGSVTTVTIFKRITICSI